MPTTTAVRELPPRVYGLRINGTDYRTYPTEQAMLDAIPALADGGAVDINLLDPNSDYVRSLDRVTPYDAAGRIIVAVASSVPGAVRAVWPFRCMKVRFHAVLTANDYLDQNDCIALHSRVRHLYALPQ